MDWGLVLGILNLLCVLGVLRGLIEIRRAIEDSIQDLDHKLAATIQNLVESGLGGFEAPNPIQQAIAHMLVNRVPAGIEPAAEALRTETGKFTKSD